jgi:hypothetical protein
MSNDSSMIRRKGRSATFKMPREAGVRSSVEEKVR